MKEQISTFIIVREDRGLDPTTLVVEGLKIGRDPDRDLLLNHPDVSRLQAGIKEIEGRFYLFSLSAQNSTTLNGRLVASGEPEVIASGDEVRIGPFFLRMERKDKALQIAVTLQFGLRIGEVEARDEAPAAQAVASEVATPAAEDVAQALDLFWGKRSREKAARKSLLHPRRPPRLGKARFNWTPTRDLVRPWPWSVFLWSAVVLGVLSITAALGYTAAYAPGPVSNAHSRTNLAMMPAVAKQPNGGACTNCHSVTSSMQTRCTSCHTTEAFVATVTSPHAAAGIACVDCHAEHKWNAIGPMQAALNSCTRCHTDKNGRTYNGHTVGTPHGGTLGYPVVNGEWKWKGLDPEELAAKPKIAALRLPTDSEQVWRNKQFHALHIYNVRATGGVTGVAGTEAGSPPVLSCSSCHRTLKDREYPRQTCAKCHSGSIDPSGRVSVAAGAPNCISCHVQHVQNKRHWNPDLMAASLPPAAEGK
jgi:hypothetical protein